MEKNKKNRIISFIVTFFYSLMSGISFLCFYHNVVISSWLLEIIVSIVLLLALSLLSYKKIKTIILPIMMTIMIGIIYSFQSFYYGFFGIMNYIIECYNIIDEAMFINLVDENGDIIENFSFAQETIR